MGNINTVEVEFFKDKEEGSHIKGTYLLIIKNNTKESTFFTEEEVVEMQQFAEMAEYSGHIPLHDWIREKRPGFFSNAITNSDTHGIVIQILQKLQEYFHISSTMVVSNKT